MAKTVKDQKYSFGNYTGDNLKKLVDKYVSEVENASFDKTQSLMELCLGIICRLIGEGVHLDINEVAEVWRMVNKKSKRKKVKDKLLIPELELPD